MKKQLLLLAIFASISSSAQIFSSTGNIGATTNSVLPYVGIGTNTPTEKLVVSGGHYDSTILVHSTGNGTNQPSNLMLWASEPGLTYYGAGIGGNIKNYDNGETFKLINPQIGGSYIRLLDNQMNFNVVTNTGNKQQVVTLSPNKLEIAGGVYSSRNTTEGGSLTVLNALKTGANDAQAWTIYNMTGSYGNSLQFWSYLPNNNGSPRLKISDDGNMALYGKFEAKEIKVTLTPTADFVFEEKYNLPKLEDVEKHIKEKKHLPEIASAKQMEREGVNVGEFQIKLLQKIEELTLYSIEQNKMIKEQQKRIETLENSNNHKNK